MIRLILLASLCWSLAATAEVYKWVDKDGNVHFTDQKPEAEKNAETVDTSFSELSETRQQAAEQRIELLRQSEISNKASQAEYTDRRAQQRDKNREARAKRDAACARGRSDLAITERSNRLYTTDENGERSYLSDEQRVARTTAARKLIADHCN